MDCGSAGSVGERAGVRGAWGAVFVGGAAREADEGLREGRRVGTGQENRWGGGPKEGRAPAFLLDSGPEPSSLRSRPLQTVDVREDLASVMRTQCVRAPRRH